MSHFPPLAFHLKPLSVPLGLATQLNVSNTVAKFMSLTSYAVRETSVIGLVDSVEQAFKQLV